MRVIIIEDEPHSQEVLVKLLNKFHPDIQILDAIDKADAAIKSIEENQPDLIFLDIELKMQSGFDILDKIDYSSFQIIFTTAFEHYALRAIRYAAIDYLLKPIAIDELAEAIQKAKLKSANKNNNINHIQTMLTNLQEPNTRIAIPTIEGFDFIPINDVIYCKADAGYSVFNLKGNIKLVSSKPLKYYENIVESKYLFRVSKSFLVNISYIKKYIKGKTPYVILDTGESIDVSPNNKASLLECLKNI